MRPTEPSSHSCPAPNQDPVRDPETAHAFVPADTRQSAGPGSRPGPPPVSEGHAGEAARPTGDAATPPALPAQPQGEEPTPDATKEMGGPPQRTETPPPAAGLPQTGKPSRGADQQAIQHAGPPGMAANGSGEASTAGQRSAEPEEPMPNAGHEAGLHPPSDHGAQPAGRADAAPLATPAHHADASAPGEEPPRVRSRGNHTRQAPARGQQGSLTQPAQLQQRLFGCLHAVLHE